MLDNLPRRGTSTQEGPATVLRATTASRHVLLPTYGVRVASVSLPPLLSFPLSIAYASQQYTRMRTARADVADTHYFFDCANTKYIALKA